MIALADRDGAYRERWFVAYVARQDAAVAARRSTWPRLHHPTRGDIFLCPCCGLPTLPERGGYEICVVCFWEDDGQDDPHAEEVWGGPNHHYSLSAARANFASYLTMYAPGDDRFERLRGDAQALAVKRRIVESGTALGASPDPAGAARLWDAIDAAMSDLRAALHP